MEYIIKDDDTQNSPRYYRIDQGSVSGLKEVRVFVPDVAAPYPYAIAISDKDGNQESILCLDYNGVKELMEALLKVL